MEDSLVEYGFRRVIITMIAIVATLLELLDVTIVNVAINDMRGNLGATLSEVGWVVTAYAIGNVIIVPMTGWLGRQFGRRNYFAASIILFTVASFFCGNSTNIIELSIFRFIQGLGGGALLATSQTILTESYPAEKRGLAQGIYGLGVVVGPTLGPTIGGVIIDHFSWPFIFYVNVPVGIVAALLTIMYIRNPESESRNKAKEVDWLGIFLLAVTVGSLQYVLEHGQEDDWFNNKIITLLSVTFIVGVIFFLWRELTYKHPIVQLRALKNGNLRTGVLLCFMWGFGVFGSTFILPIYTQSILGWTATQTGVLMIPQALLAAFMMPILGKAMHNNANVKIVVAIGMSLFFIYCFWSYKIFTPDMDEAAFFWVLLVRGASLAFLFVSVLALSFATLQKHEIADGAAFTNMARQLGGSFGIALITTFVAQRSQLHRVDLISHLQADDPMVLQRVSDLQHGLMANGVSGEAALNGSYQILELTVTKQAAILSYMDVFLYVGVLFLICIPFIFIAKSHKKV